MTSKKSGASEMRHRRNLGEIRHQHSVDDFHISASPSGFLTVLHPSYWGRTTPQVFDLSELSNVSIFYNFGHYIFLPIWINYLRFFA